MIKTLTFAVMHFSVAFAVAYSLTGDIVVGGAVALIEPLVNTVGYAIHEHIWTRLRQRRQVSPRSAEIITAAPCAA